MKKLFVLLTFAVFVFGLAGAAFAIGDAVTAGQSALGYTNNSTGYSIVNTYHNLGYTTTAMGSAHPISTSAGTDEICVFCHTPHYAAQPDLLWNHAATTITTSNADWGMTNSATTSGTRTTNVALTSSTLRCLGCHDGSQAIGQVNFAYTITQTTPPLFGVTIPTTPVTTITGRYQLGGTLTAGGQRSFAGQHPVSIPYAGASYNSITSGITSLLGQFTTASAAANAAGGAVVLYTSPSAGNSYPVAPGAVTGLNDGIECGSCHDVHGQQNPTNSGSLPSHLGQLIRVGTTGSKLCLTCHVR